MDASDLADRNDGSGLQLLDVREPSEWDGGHIAGSLHLPLGQLDGRMADLERRRPVVVVCHSGGRSSSAAESLRDAGFDAESLDGGLQAWIEADRPLVRDDGSPGRLVEPPDTSAGLQELLFSLVEGLQERVGDREPTEEEAREYLRERMRAQGRSEAEIDALIEDLDAFDDSFDDDLDGLDVPE